MKENYCKNEEIGLRIGIEEMRRNLEAQLQGIDSIKANARTIFGSASLIVSLISALGLLETNPCENIRLLYFSILSITGLLYVVLVVLSIWILSPVSMEYPVKSDWDVIYDYFMGDELSVLQTHLNAYISTIQNNRKFITIRQLVVKISGILLGGIVILLLILSFIIHL